MTRQRKTQCPAIEFFCQYCGNEMTAEGSKAGTKGRCPKCRMVITIPKASMNEPEDFDLDAILHNKKLSQLYRQFTDNHDERILDQLPLSKSIDGEVRDTLVLNLRQPSGRRQRIGVTTANIETIAVPDKGSILADVQFVSWIGFVGDNYELCYRILRAMYATCFNACIDPNGVLMLKAVRRLDNLNYDEFEALMFDLSRLADHIEEQIIGTDEN